MAAHNPTVSVLITTYNRSRLVRRAILSVLAQDFEDYEIIVVDDCSSDDTKEVIATLQDSRIRYLRNESNVGSKGGDRAILRRLIYELMRGQYFVYLCDDDYWLLPDLLSRQVKAFRSYDNVAMVMGGQLSYFLSTPESYFGHATDNTLTVSLDNLERFFDRTTKKPKSSHFYFHGTDKPLFPNGCLTSKAFLSEFAKEPAAKNIIVGATLYSRDIFIRSGALKSQQGSQWQAGYELLMGPPCYGSVIYINEPCILTEVRAGNASFQRTQVEHYLDAIKSVEIAFSASLGDPTLKHQRVFLKQIKGEAIRNLTSTFLCNSLTILQDGGIGLCSADNVKYPLRLHHVLPVLWHNQILPSRSMLHYGKTFEQKYWRARFSQNWQLVEQPLRNVVRPLWRSLPQRVRDILRPL